MRDRLKRFVDSGQLGPFANGYWGHPAYLLPPEANLLLVAHYLEALDWSATWFAPTPSWAGRTPHPAAGAPSGLNGAAVGALGEIARRAQAFVAGVLLPDVELVARSYPEWSGLGRGLGNYLACGDYVEADGAPPYFPGGRILGGDLSRVMPVDQGQVVEHVARSWYKGEAARHPWDGETAPRYDGPEPPVESLASSNR